VKKGVKASSGSTTAIRLEEQSPQNWIWSWHPLLKSRVQSIPQEINYCSHTVGRPEIQEGANPSQQVKPRLAKYWSNKESAD